MGIDEGRREKAKGNDAHRTDDEKIAITLPLQTSSLSVPMIGRDEILGIWDSGNPEISHLFLEFSNRVIWNSLEFI